LIVALAGHVDHGKTALIRALTGVETDRLPEERRRGMTIDLGFAYLHTDDGRSIGFVDVPGHERFLPNMLAGVLGISSALLIIATDDGPMPQTLEHLAILQLTGARDITAVITKADMVPPERIAEVVEIARDLLARHGYPNAPVHTVSALTGAGIAELRADLLARQPAPAPPGAGFRMAIDRRFSLQGIGLVVTGTVAAGSVAVGDMLVLSPPRLSARIRSIRVQDRDATTARAGDRCALAITGARIDADRVQRGQWLLAPDLHAPTAAVDVQLCVADGQILRHGRPAHMHLGTGAIACRIRLLGAKDVTEGETYARLVLDHPIPALTGDRAVLRDDGSGRIIAGGRVVDPFPPRRRERRETWRARLDALASPDPIAALTGALAADGSVDLARFALARNLPLASITSTAGIHLVGDTAHPVAISDILADALRDRLRTVLAEWHAAHPDHIGPNKAQLLARASHRADAAIADAVLHGLAASGAVQRTDAYYHLPNHAPRLSAADETLFRRIAAILDAAGLRAPRVRELNDELGAPLDETTARLERLTRFGRLHRVAANRYFLPGTVAQLRAVAAELAAGNDGFTAAEFNRRSGIGRNLTIQVLEHLDRIGATERTGEVRHMVRDS